MSPGNVLRQHSTVLNITFLQYHVLVVAITNLHTYNSLVEEVNTLEC